MRRRGRTGIGRTFTRFLIGAGIILIALVFISDIFGGSSERESNRTEDDEASKKGNISVDPFTVEQDEDYPGERSYPDYKGIFAVPDYGVRVDLANTAAPEAGWEQDHALSWGTAHLISSDDFVRPTNHRGTVVVFINAREGLDAVANPLLDEDTQDPITEEEDLFILDGVGFELRDTARLAVEDLEPGTAPLLKEEGSALVMAYLIQEDGEPTGELVVFTLDRALDDEDDDEEEEDGDA